MVMMAIERISANLAARCMIGPLSTILTDGRGHFGRALHHMVAANWCCGDCRDFVFTRAARWLY
jgi:hypothetical protein